MTRRRRSRPSRVNYNNLLDSKPYHWFRAVRHRLILKFLLNRNSFINFIQSKLPSTRNWIPSTFNPSCLLMIQHFVIGIYEMLSNSVIECGNRRSITNWFVSFQHRSRSQFFLLWTVFVQHAFCLAAHFHQHHSINFMMDNWIKCSFNVIARINGDSLSFWNSGVVRRCIL
jgi:hypothetical protein